MRVASNFEKAYRLGWMNEDQWECHLMLADLMNGFNHTFGTIKPSSDDGISIAIRYEDWSTFDFDRLTRAVFMAHDRCIRFEISHSSSGYLRLSFHKRKREADDICRTHPTLEQALEKFRKKEC